MTRLSCHRGSVVIEAAVLLPLLAVASIVLVDVGLITADRIALTRVATRAAVEGRVPDEQSLRRIAPQRLTKSLSARTVEGQLTVSAHPSTLLLGSVSKLSVRSTVDLANSPEGVRR